MTAAYDDDTISSRRQENVKNTDVPVDFSPQKLSAINSQDKSAAGDRSVSAGGDGGMSENRRDSGQNTEELSPQTSVESKTVNSSITGRCVDVENVVVNKDDVNCTSPDRGNPLETCLMLRKQKNVEEEIIINSDTQETFSCVDVRNSIVSHEISRINTGEKISEENLIDDKLYPELIADCSELNISSSNNSKINYIPEEKDSNSNLTDENKSQELNMISREHLIGDETLPVNYFNPERNGVKIISETEYYSESLNAREEAPILTMNSRDEKTPRNVRRSKTDSGAWGGDNSPINTSNYELSKEDSFEDYDPECEMSFHEAIRAGDAKSVEMLMEGGFVQNIDEPDWNVSGDPPLLIAATNHSLPVLRALLSNGCDPGVRSPRGETALHRAILNGSPSRVFEIVEELLNHDCPSTVKEAGGGLTALHILTRQLAHAQSSKSLYQNFDIALKTLALLAKVGPVDARDHQGRSALHLLASSSTFGNSHRIEIEPMIRTLLEAGADPALKNDRGETPLHEALECGALNTAFLLIPHTPVGITSRYGETPLHIAARKNQPEVVDSLLKRGEDPSFQDAGGNTPLHLASARGFHHTVSLLVTSPLAQLEKTNDDGLTSLQVAAESGFVNAVRILLKAGADPSQTAHYCVTTLDRHPDISVLIDHELTRRRQLAA